MARFVAVCFGQVMAAIAGLGGITPPWSDWPNAPRLLMESGGRLLQENGSPVRLEE